MSLKHTTPDKVHLLHGADDYVGGWINEQISGEMTLPTGPFTAIGAIKNNELIAGIMFFNRQPNDITVALVVDRLFTAPRIVASVMRYPFIQLGLNRVSAEIAASNKRCIRMAEGMGFELEGIKSAAADDGGNLMIYGLMKDNFRLKEFL